MIYDKEEFQRLHWLQQTPIRKIAEIWQVTPYEVYKWVEKEKIPVKRGKYTFSRDFLFKWYWEDELDMNRIANNLGVNRNCVHNILVKLKIPIRSRSECMKLSYKKGDLKRKYLLREKNHLWRGGRSKHQKGYNLIYMLEHHRVRKSKYVLEHIVIWENHNKKQLPYGWVIHHLNGIPDDNRPENLIALSDKKHRNVLAAKAKRIQELEALLKNQGQLV